MVVAQWNGTMQMNVESYAIAITWYSIRNCDHPVENTQLRSDGRKYAIAITLSKIRDCDQMIENMQL